MFQQAVRRPRRRQPAVERRSRRRRARSTAGSESTYIAEPPFFDGFGMQPGTAGRHRAARASSASSATRSPPTTSARPARSSRPRPPGKYLQEHGVAVADFNTLRRAPRQPRGHDARHVRQRAHQEPDAARHRRRHHDPPAFGRAACRSTTPRCATTPRACRRSSSAARNTAPGSSRDWAAKGTQLLGVKAVIARSFERIHRANLVGMGVLPLQFKGGDARAVARHRRATRPSTSSASRRASRPLQDVTLVINAQGRQAREACRVQAAHRHADRGRLLQARRDPAVRAAGTDAVRRPRQQGCLAARATSAGRKRPPPGGLFLVVKVSASLPYAASAG